MGQIIDQQSPATGTNSWLREVYDEAPCGYYSLDKDGIFLEVNKTLQSWLGYRREELIGKTRFVDLLTAESAQIFHLSCPIFLKSGMVKDMRFELVPKYGEPLTVTVNATAIKDAQGNFLMSRSTVFEVTDQNKGDRRLSDLMAVLAHDLKNQLLGTKRIIEFLLARDLGELKPEQEEVLNLIDSGSAEQLRILQNLLDLYRYDAGVQVMHFQPITLQKVITDTLAHVKSNLQRDDVKVALDVVKDAKIKGDSHAISHLILHLVQNAIKFAKPDGKVQVTLDCSGANAAFAVSDTGLSVSGAEQELLFQNLWQGETGKRFLGSGGFGLYLCKRIVELHSGEMECYSQAGSGTTIRVLLPRTGLDERYDSKN